MVSRVRVRLPPYNEQALVKRQLRTRGVRTFVQLTGSLSGSCEPVEYVRSAYLAYR